MTQITIDSSLDANLRALGERNAVAAEAIRAAVTPSGLEVFPSGQDAPAAALDGMPLCSRHRPIDEAARLIDPVDLMEHALFVVLGFGAGHHVRRLSERLNKTGVIVVFEPDVGLLRGVFEQIDHSHWLADSLILFITDPVDRGAMAGALHGAEAIIAQGVEFIEHPGSRDRLGDAAGQFSTTFSDSVAAARTTLMTTLMRGVETTRNLLLNLDHYVAYPGIEPLRDLAAGRPAVIVSAGPSLRRNIDQLAEPGVRDRCVIIAVQTTLKPLLKAGIKPHFVTALDYHEISRRFYDGLTADDVAGVTLVAEAKAHPIILDVFPGLIRCCTSPFLDQVLGDVQQPMGELAAGATVAHLALYLASFLGCNPIGMIGQDLGFTDGLYYAPGTAIHDVWAPELNPFNTIEMMEWQRIVRHRSHLHKTTDVEGRTIYTDAQMHTYLQQFERDFAEFQRQGLTIIDATEGGVAKQHTLPMPLRDMLSRHAAQPLPAIPMPPSTPDSARITAAGRRIDELRDELRILRDASRRTVKTIRQMLREQGNPAQMNRHFKKIEANRKIVEEHFQTFELLNNLNQLGVFKRMKADRRLHLQKDLDPKARQRGQLERDLENVIWIEDAAEEFIAQLTATQRVLAGEEVTDRPKPVSRLDADRTKPPQARSRIAALVAIDPDRNGLGIERRLDEPIDNRTVLQATLEHLGQSSTIESIVCIAPEELDVEAMIDRDRIGRPVIIERCDGSPFGPQQEAIAVARLFAVSSWRGGIAGMSIFDEIVCPQVMSRIMQRRRLTAAMIVGADWPFVDVTSPGGCDALVTRHLEHPDQLPLVFTQAPPGLSGCVISASLMAELAEPNRLATVGAMLGYQPHRPQHDPVARDANVQIEHIIRRSFTRATFDTKRHRARMNRAASENTIQIVESLEHAELELLDLPPQHIVLELCTDRDSAGRFAEMRGLGVSRPPIAPALADQIFQQIGCAGDAVVTLDGVGDPLCHEALDKIITAAKRAGVRAVHVRTELRADQRAIDRLLASGVDVVSVDLHADRQATYIQMMGDDRFRDVLLNLQYLAEHRRAMVGDANQVGTLALPWIVPRMIRCDTTYEDIDSFFDRWVQGLGVAVIEGQVGDDDTLAPAVTPHRVVMHQLLNRMTIRCDGSVPFSELDWAGDRTVGNVSGQPLSDIWRELIGQRRAADEAGETQWTAGP